MANRGIAAPLQRLFAEMSPTVRIIVLINAVVFIVPYLLDQLGVVYKSVLISDLLVIYGAKDNIAIAAADQYYRFVTMMFLHGNLIHLLFNTYAIVQIGTSVEELSDQKRFLGIYFVGGFVGGVASYYFTAAPSVGASGAIFALIGAQGMFVWLNRAAYGDQAKQILANIAFMALINIFFGYSMPNIDNMAHIGGLVGGLITGYLLLPRLTLSLTEFGAQRSRRHLAWGWNGVIALVVVLFVVVSVVTPAFEG
ncbi:MAG: hypothetical protein RLZZ297_826 [Chloroflexota bacterium]